MNTMLGIAECFIWHVLCGGPVVVVHRVLLAILSIILCQTHHAPQHLKVAKWALYPSGKRLEYSKRKFGYFDGFNFREPLVVCGSFLWFFQIVTTLIIQPIFTAITMVLTLRTLSKHWDSIWRINLMLYTVDIVDEDWTPPLPLSKGPYDPAKKCKISLRSARGRWVVSEGGDVHCHQLRLPRPRGILTSHPKGDGKVALELHGGRWLSAGTVWKWLWHCRKDIVSVADCAECDDIYSVETVSDGVIALKTADNQYLSAPNDYTLRWSRDEITCSEQFTVIVHGESDEAEGTATATAQTSGSVEDIQPDSDLEQTESVNP